MKSFPWLPLGICVALVVAPLAIVKADYDKLKSQAASQASCKAYLTTGGAGSRQACDPVLLDLADAARKSMICDKALKLGGYAPECSVEVAKLFTDRAGLRTALDDTLADQADAISRAEVRATKSAQRKFQDVEVLKAAPRGPDGLIVCNADCLRSRFEQPSQ